MASLSPLQLAALAAATGGPPLLLTLLPLYGRRFSDRTQHLMLGLSAGILLGISLVDILPEAFALAFPTAANPAPAYTPAHVSIGIAAGFFLLLLAERFLLHASEVGHVHYADDARIRPFGTLALSALAFHGFMDGFVIPLGFELSTAVGTIIAAAIMLHQIPDSFAAASVAMAGLPPAGRGRRGLLAVAITSADTPLGMGAALAFLGLAPPGLLGLGLAFVAGTFLFVSVADLIPELQHRARSTLVVLSILAGFVAVAGLTLALPL